MDAQHFIHTLHSSPTTICKIHNSSITP